MKIHPAAILIIPLQAFPLRVSALLTVILLTFNPLQLPAQSDWHVVLRSDSLSFGAFSFPDELKGWITTYNPDAVGRKAGLLTTSDGGMSWDRIESNVSPMYSILFFVDHQHGWGGSGLA